MIYTSYFANLRNLPENIIPISICAKPPYWYKGLQYKKLAPSYNLLMHWKENHDEEFYKQIFNEEILNNLNAYTVVMELKHLCEKYLYSKQDICLLCYENPKDFCHRQLVREWLIKNGFECEEFIK